MGKESDNEFYFKEITPKAYSYMHKDRENGTGCGIALIIQSDFIPRLVKASQFTSFESLTASISSSRSRLRRVVVYHPPSSSYQQFFDKFTSLLEGLLSSLVPFIIAGDFNLHVDNINNPNTVKFLNILSSQHVTESTHIAGHTLDLVITNSNDDIRIDFPTIGDLISDYYAVKCSLSIFKSSVQVKTTQVRNLKDIDV